MKDIKQLLKMPLKGILRVKGSEPVTAVQRMHTDSRLRTNY
jgi:hypothetical protein